MAKINSILFKMLQFQLQNRSIILRTNEDVIESDTKLIIVKI